MPLNQEIFPLDDKTLFKIFIFLAASNFIRNFKKDNVSNFGNADNILKYAAILCLFQGEKHIQIVKADEEEKRRLKAAKDEAKMVCYEDCQVSITIYLFR